MPPPLIPDTDDESVLATLETRSAESTLPRRFLPPPSDIVGDGFADDDFFCGDFEGEEFADDGCCFRGESCALVRR